VFLSLYYLLQLLFKVEFIRGFLYKFTDKCTHKYNPFTWSIKTNVKFLWKLVFPLKKKVSLLLKKHHIMCFCHYFILLQQLFLLMVSFKYLHYGQILSKLSIERDKPH